jgi:pimeloyl-ACP methyl ester carboxylesterase
MRAPLRWLTQIGAGFAARLPVPRLVLQTMLLGNHRDPELLAELDASVRSVSPTVLASRLRMLASVDARSDLEDCRAPILYLAGAFDRLISSANASAITADPRVRTQTLPAPHLVLQTQPDAAMRAIAAFVLGSPGLAKIR